MTNVPPIQIHGYTRSQAADNIPFAPIPERVLQEWAIRAADRLQERFDGSFDMTYVTSGDGLVVVTIGTTGTIDVYYTRILDHHMYQGDS